MNQNAMPASGAFVDTAALPFCKGCGHHLVSRSCEKALRKAGFESPLDVVLVTDIGCIGIVDKQFHTHTVHGLHGRSIALAAGISMALADPARKVLVFIGDGGATIGLQHLMEAAQKNMNMTVVVHNNMLYGMTGGQPSGLTPSNFNTTMNFAQNAGRGYDLCHIVHELGAPHAARVVAAGDISDPLAEALAVQGFSLLEVVELCPSYGVKSNPGQAPAALLKEVGIEPVVYRQPGKPAFRVPAPGSGDSLLDTEAPIEQRFASELTQRRDIVLAGAAGGGVQVAAELFARAAIASGLWAVKRGIYPVTVGIGFSTAELVIAPRPIRYTGVDTPDTLIAVSPEGLDHRRKVAERMKAGALYLDTSLAPPPSGAWLVQQDFRTPFTPRSAALLSLFTLLKRDPIFPVEALVHTIKTSRLGGRIDADTMAEQA